LPASSRMRTEPSSGRANSGLDQGAASAPGKRAGGVFLQAGEDRGGHLLAEGRSVRVEQKLSSFFFFDETRPPQFLERGGRAADPSRQDPAVAGVQNQVTNRTNSKLRQGKAVKTRPAHRGRGESEAGADQAAQKLRGTLRAEAPKAGGRSGSEAPGRIGAQRGNAPGRFHTGIDRSKPGPCDHLGELALPAGAPDCFRQDRVVGVRDPVTTDRGRYGIGSCRVIGG